MRRHIDVGDVSLLVTEYGNGDPLILLHGIGSRGVSWLPVIDDLATRFHLIVPDMRGHGESDKPESGYLPNNYAADLSGLIAALELDRPGIVGHSLGGLVTITWAMANPAARCILLEDVPFRGGSRSTPLFDEWIALASMTVEDAAAHYKRENPDWTEEDCFRRAVSITSTALPVFTELRDRSSTAESPDWIAGLAGLQTPSLLIYGDLDTGSMVVPSDAQRFAKEVPGAQAIHIAGGSHSLHRDQTTSFLDAALPFLAGARRP